MTDIIQCFPPELSNQVLGHVFVPEVQRGWEVVPAWTRVHRTRCRQVNRTFRDAIVASSLIQHKIEPFSAGLEYNAAAGIGLTDSRQVFLEYRSRLDPLYPNEEVTLDGVCREGVGLSTTGGGIYAITENDSLRLLTFGSGPSQGALYKE